jgi:hypothetical protein
MNQPLLPFSETIKSGKGFIYFATDGDLIKIGWTGIWPPSKRIKRQQTGNGNQIWLLGCVPGSLKTERRYHEEFSQHRVIGEWFRPVPELEAFIRATQLMDVMELAAS